MKTYRCGGCGNLSQLERCLACGGTGTAQPRTFESVDGFGIRTTWTEGDSFIWQRRDGGDWNRLDYDSPEAAEEAYLYVDSRRHYGR